jgi:tripartite-type tricarboxylate transporter receptor subunit TctC
VSTTARSPHAPDIPAIAETLPGYDVTPWQGIFAPAGTPDDRVARVGAAIQAMLQDEASQAQMKTLGVIPAWRNAAEMDAYVDLETKRWGKVIPPLNIQLD